MKQAVIITGALGGIGQALCTEFTNAGYTVIGVDRAEGEVNAAHFLHGDIQSVTTGGGSALLDEIKSVIADERLALHGLVNNAAIQILGTTETLDEADWLETLRTNLMAPFFLAQALLEDLAEHHGAVINISSIHERLTKRGFLAYATSKAALSGLTRAMAVDLGSRVRVNAICPAAIETPMLLAGFEGKPNEYAALHGAHPTGIIGQPEDVAKLARYLVAEAPPFLTGSCLGLDGGISGRLHDPG